MPTRIEGLGVSPGTAHGPVARLAPPPRPPAGEQPGADPAAELGRVGAALEQVAVLLSERAVQVGGEAGDVLTATALMARDPSLIASVKGLLEQGRPTAAALDAAVESVCDVLAGLGGYMAERVSDLRDVRNRALAVLLDLPMPGIPHPGHPFVLVGHDLSPADTATLDPAEVLAIVTVEGGPTSHTAILAKGLGVPAVVQAVSAAGLTDGSTVVVDGSTGLVTVDPSPELVAAVAEQARVRKALAATGSGPGRTADDVPVALLANIATVEDARRAGALDCEGVGLFRTEGLYLGRQSAPSLEEQEASYREVLGYFTGRKVVVRTLDAGADKPLAFVDHGDEENPALGLRGLRVSWKNPGLLQTQLEALGRAAAAVDTEVWVMAPMVATPSEATGFVEAARAAGLSVAGAMIEVPAAALRASRVLATVDFVSIGTNDLAQYTFAADRMQGELAGLLDPWQPALLDLIAAVGEAGSSRAVPVGVCGEAAGDPLLACVLVGLGVRSLSMAPGLVATVRLVLAAHSLAECRAMAEAARDADDATSARAAVRALVKESVTALL
ncbi:phosphoenolpyruvate--protein phosphotransferase [Kineosporia succinea]|uniref:Phosphoenolpyruvate-protein phosphotransferase n=1 Tax=Kineosporia succinea TaxID=84632 RepID=A0ABT9PES3_9ACTN|nr:phosphoenolpyruvate--protein phosphotransferase [Kineosporia succinea]MDP9831208.1 phosphotransferase system enzyme I (PtsI) [Kineosporia succinea]